MRRPQGLARGGRGIVVAIFITFGLVSALCLTLSITSADRSRNGAAEVEVVARQRTLAERYVSEVLFARQGLQADPAGTIAVMQQSVGALLHGGHVPAVPGDDDDVSVPAATSAVARAQLVEEDKLLTDLAAAGAAVLTHQPASSVALTGGETVPLKNTLERLRVVGALTSNVALNAARTIATQADDNITNLITMQVILGTGGLIVSLLLAWALIVTTRRRSAHFRRLVTSSSDLVFVFGADGCRFVSDSLRKLVGQPEADLLGRGLEAFVCEEDRASLREVVHGEVPPAMMLRVRDAAGAERHLEAHLTDLREDRYLRGVIVSARDVTERVRLEEEFQLQARRDAFGSQIVEALEMADDEHSAYTVVERAMIEIAAQSPMELLLSDSSRAHLERVASSPSAGAPGCSVQSPFACVAVRRGQPVEFESSEALNACPKLRGRSSGPCSATCVPVSFMGRALGVLHATGPDGALGSPEQLSSLTTLATQAGARIGTVRAFEKTQLQASTDGLTGLMNRRTFERRVRELLAHGRLVSMAIADLDGFKALNDTYGHEAGDRALRLFAQVAQEALRDRDVLGRWGGDEFVLALPEIASHQAAAVLERMREQLAAAHTGEHPMFTSSFGVTDSSTASSLEELFQQADVALYDSKRSGRDRVTVADPPSEKPGSDGNGSPANGNGHGRPGMRPPLYDAVDEEEPRPTGLEIR